MKKDVLDVYHDYLKKIGNRKSIYGAITNNFTIKSALYPGSHVDIVPSLVIPKVTYIDNFKGTVQFFKNLETIEDYLNLNKEYADDCEIHFLGQDYTHPFTIEKVDLIISQYAGFVGQATKFALKTAGLLLCNDSHGDATLARFDKDFELIGVIDQKGNIQTKNLEKYFTLPKDRAIDLDFVKSKMKGLNYKYTAPNYLFQKIS